MDRLRANRKVFKEFAFRETDSKPSEHSDQHEFEATTLCQTIRDLLTPVSAPLIFRHSATPEFDAKHSPDPDADFHDSTLNRGVLNPRSA